MDLLLVIALTQLVIISLFIFTVVTPSGSTPVRRRKP